MADIKKELNDIKNAVYGKEVRGAIHDGIKKINDEVENATDLSESAKHQVENIQQQVNQLVIEGDSSVEAAQARVDAEGKSFPTLKARLDEKETQFSSRLAQTAYKTTGSLGAIWFPPEQPSSDEIITSKTDPEHYINGLFEPLRNEFPEYITREVLGQSGGYNFYKYIFEPEHYEKTVILGAMLHGTENHSVRYLYRFLYHVCHDWDKYPQMQYAREKIRFIVLPVQNPSGTALGTRNNGNDVDLNRNFDYNWEASNDPYKGSAPHSEVETQMIDSVLNQYKDEATVYLDIHNTPAGDRYYCEVPKTAYNNANTIRGIIESIKPIPEPKTLLVTNDISTASTYAAHKYDMHALTAEWTPGTNGTEPYSSEDVYEAVKFLGNLIIKLALKERPSNENRKEVEGIRTGINTASVEVTSDTYQEITEFTLTLKPKFNGLLVLNGDLVGANATDGELVFLSPVITQDYNPAIPPSRISYFQSVNETFAHFRGGLNGRNYLGFSAMAPVLQTNERYGDVVIKFYVKSEGSRVIILRLRHNIVIIPTEKESFARYEFGTGGLYQSYP